MATERETSRAPGTRPRGRRAVVAGLALALLFEIERVLRFDAPWATGAWERFELGALVAPRDAYAFAWFGFALGVVVVALLLATVRFWHAPGPVATVRSLVPLPPREGRRVRAALVMLAIATLGLLGWPRLFQSFGGDELYSVEHAIHGRWHIKDGEPDHDGVKWRDVFWFYDKPNNHVPYSVVARTASKAWMDVHEEDGHRRIAFEPAVRGPVLVFGMGAVATTYALVARTGFPIAGVLAAWLLALHPWFLRYATEGRGYSILLLAIGGLLLAGLRVLERGSWGRWAAWGALEVLVIWAYPPAVFVVAVANVAVLAETWRLHGGSDRMAPQVKRWGVATLVGATVFLQLMIPNLVQLAGYLENEQLGWGGERFLRDLGAELIAGIPWGRADGHLEYPELVHLHESHPLLLALVVTTLVALAAGGAWRLARSGRTQAWWTAILLLPAPIVLAVAAWRGNYLYTWYLIFFLPSLAAFVAIGVDGALEWLGHLVPRGAPRKGAIAAGAVVFLGAFAWFTAHPRAVLRERSFEPKREVAERIRGDLDPLAPAAREILTSCIHDKSFHYDPWCALAREPEDLHREMTRAERTGRPLYVHYGRRELVEKRHPELVALVDDAALFEPVETLLGYDRHLTRHVLRYRPERERRAANAPAEPRARSAGTWQPLGN